MTLDEYARKELEAMRASGLARNMMVLETGHGKRAVVAGRELLLFNSNDYLGLARHPAVVGAAAKALRDFGFGSPASRLICGTTRAHRELEEELARFKGKEAAVTFPTGYMANMGAIGAVARRGDLVVSDELNHASIVDACRLCGAEIRVCPHLDVDAMRAALSGAARRRAFIVTDAVFSMDGDVAPLPELRELADEAGAWLVVDEAHATGVLGATGRGIAEHFGGAAHADLAVGTMGKALGGMGGFVAGSADLVGLITGRARTMLYTTAAPPAVCAGVLAALRILEAEPGRVDELRRKSALLRSEMERAGLRAPKGATPIVPAILGSADRAMKASGRLFDKGFMVNAIRPPSVPEGTSRLRVTVSADHEDAEISAFAMALAEVVNGLGS